MPVNTNRMVENVFLTEKRRKVLDGTDELSDSSRTVEKSRIRKRARMALRELEEVAQSDQIENRSIFEPEGVGRLLFWIQQDAGSLENATKPENEWDAAKVYTEAHKQYIRNLHFEMNKQMNKFDLPTEGYDS